MKIGFVYFAIKFYVQDIKISICFNILNKNQTIVLHSVFLMQAFGAFNVKVI
jgi:hypothetical protein